MRATVLLERVDDLQGELWVFPFLISSRPELYSEITRGAPPGLERTRYFYDQGAIDADMTSLKLVLEGRRNSPVVVTAIRAVVVSKTAMVDTGASLLVPSAEGGNDSVVIGFDLDSPDLNARVVDLNPEGDSLQFGSRYFQANTIALARNEQQVLQVFAQTRQSNYEWRIAIALVVAGRAQTVTADVNGRTLRTCAVHSSPLGGPDESLYSEVYEFDKDRDDSVSIRAFRRKK